MDLQEQIEQHLKEQNWRVIEGVLNLNNCCKFAYHRIGYKNGGRDHHKSLGNLRACRNCWACFQLGLIPTEEKPSVENCEVPPHPKKKRKTKYWPKWPWFR